MFQHYLSDVVHVSRQALVIVFCFVLKTSLTTIAVPFARAKRDVDSAYFVCALLMTCRLESIKCARVLGDKTKTCTVVSKVADFPAIRPHI